MICQNMMQFISWAIIKRLTESESVLPKRGIKAHFGLTCSPSIYIYHSIYNYIYGYYTCAVLTVHVFGYLLKIHQYMLQQQQQQQQNQAVSEKNSSSQVKGKNVPFSVKFPTGDTLLLTSNFKHSYPM